MANKSRQPEAPPALKHGLTSRWFADSLADEVEALTPLLVGASPRHENIMAAARRAAEAILQFHHVRSVKLHILGQAKPASSAPEKLLPNIAQCLPEDAYQLLEDEMRERMEMMMAFEGKKVPRRRGTDTAADALLGHLDAEGALLARLDDYERRALSRRAKALRVLICTES